MKKFGSLNIKVALFLSGVVIAILVLFFTQMLVNRIQKKETQIAELYAKSLEYLANDTSSSGEYNFIFNEIVTQIDFPVIATDKDYKKVEFFKNVDIDTTLPLARKNALLLEMAKNFIEINPPIKVTYNESIVIYYLNYGQSSLITQLKLFPIFEILIGAMFILLGYVGFSYIKKNEQSSLWVGLSKETAHQLGTPLTSLMGWVEMIRNSEPGTENQNEMLYEISNDLDKLNKIAGRFSKIGSQPILKQQNIVDVIKGVCAYFEKRIPNLVGTDGKVTKKVNIEFISPETIQAKINRDLFEWVIENLLKNALDAMEKHTGSIRFNIHEKGREVLIDVTDNGRGIDLKFKKDIFRPGYSTKKRGWGLGLSLAKRIIEDYHKGKLLLYLTNPEQGTTFRIKLEK